MFSTLYDYEMRDGDMPLNFSENTSLATLHMCNSTVSYCQKNLNGQLWREIPLYPKNCCIKCFCECVRLGMLTSAI